MSQQAYYVPESSKLPFAMAISLLVFIIGAAKTVIDAGTESNSYMILLLSFAMIWVTMYFWFKQTIIENQAGLNNPMLKDSYVYGMAWFIFSEVMFFAAFFGALFYIRTFSISWLGGEGDKGLAGELLWPDFVATWPPMVTPEESLMGEQAVTKGPDESMYLHLSLIHISEPTRPY